MWPIIYSELRITITFFVISIFSIPEIKRIIRGKQKKMKNIFLLVFMSLLMVSNFCLIVYGSLDLFFQDYITQIGTYTSFNRHRDLKEIHFETGGENHHCFALHFYDNVNTNDLQEGEKYKFVYGRRTRMLLEFKAIED